MVGLEAPAKGTLELPVGSDLDGGGCLAALQGVSGPLNGGGELVVDGHEERPAAVDLAPLEGCWWRWVPCPCWQIGDGLQQRPPWSG